MITFIHLTISYVAPINSANLNPNLLSFAVLLGSDTINTHPDVWKWEKTFSDYMFDLRTSVGKGPAMFVEIITHFGPPTCTWHHTHRSKAALTLNCKLSLCTAKSINATILSFNATAVFSMRSSQRLFCMCISATEHQHIILAFDSEPTF